MQVLRSVVLVGATLFVGGCGEDPPRGNDLPVRCLDAPEPGRCRGNKTGYFYDYRHDRCRSFHYGGCRGLLPFKTLEACQETCVGSGP